MTKLATAELDQQLADALHNYHYRHETIHKILQSWADWVDRDKRMIENAQGPKSWLGQIMTSNVQQMETTETAKAVRARELFSDRVYRNVEAARATMTEHQREVMKRRYIYGWQHSKVAEKLFKLDYRRDPIRAYDKLNHCLSDIRDLVDTHIDWADVEIT